MTTKAANETTDRTEQLVLKAIEQIELNVLGMKLDEVLFLKMKLELWNLIAAHRDLVYEFILMSMNNALNKPPKPE